MRKVTWLVLGVMAVAVVVIASVVLNTPPEVSGPPIEQKVRLTLLAEGLQHPVAVTVAEGLNDRVFITDQVGLVYMLWENGTMDPQPFLDLRDRLVPLNPRYDERGLLSVAFHPNYSEDRRLFTFYSAPLRTGADAAFDHTNIVAEFTASPDGLTVDRSSERVIIEIDQPSSNHNGGQVLFGPDGYLYITVGDGGGGNDEGLGHNATVGNAQDLNSIHGKVLRVDIDAGDRYGIPADNPFVNGGGVAEIFAWGFRNPAYAAFDPQSGNLFVADAGQARFEEVDLVVKGGNYGWRYREGAHCFDPSNPFGNPTDCPDRGAIGEMLIDPIGEFKNSNLPGGEGSSVVGGAPYHGNITALKGGYIFGAFEAGGSPLFVLLPENGTWTRHAINLEDRADGMVPGYLLAVGNDLHGEVVVLSADNAGPSGGTGKIWTLDI
jgi:glucose/arabinose dehydrogenase